MKELTIENELIEKLTSLGFKKSNVKNYEDLKKNLKEKLFLLNQEKLKTPLTDNEFDKIYNYLMNGNKIIKSEKLRDKYLLKRDNESTIYIEFFKHSVNDQEEWCKNIFEVAHQIKVGDRRYDVTLLINGLPLVQIELKKNGVDLKKAFDQIKNTYMPNYQNTLFEYIQLFVISNKTLTRYFANNKNLSFDFTFTWSDENNNPYHNLFEFSDNFLKPCFLAKIIGEYIVISESKNQMFALRPYQYYAVEKIIEKVKLFSDQKGGYIWHTTGSGKTLTSFKVSQIVSKMKDIDKVLFVVDRKDLDTQTIKEYKKFDAEIEGVKNSKKLIEQFKNTKKLIVTTIQKLNRAIQKDELQEFQNKKVVLIFDECHRSQFGKTNADIKRFFKNSIMFGFTGTPIFEENGVGNYTTADVFGKCLHKYVITDAIADKNVLGFMIEYFNTTNEELKEKELLNKKRVDLITDKIIDIHNQKTKHKQFNALFATASKEMAMMYYEAFKRKNHNLKIGVIFTYAKDEDIDSEPQFSPTKDDKNTQKFLKEVIKDYNELFNTNFSADDIQPFYDDVQDRIRSDDLDITIVVGMLLTGFNHKKLNTLYVDKNLKYHGLIQAFSRTNRILNETKEHGNIVSFRDLKENVDEALRLFGNPEKNDVVLKRKYDEVRNEFVKKLSHFKEIFSTPENVANIKSEEKKVEFVKIFRDLLKIKSSLETYTEFSFEDVGINEEEWFDYISVYLDLYNESKTETEENPITEVDFSIELVRSDLINYDYIIKLLGELKEDSLILSDEYEKKKENLLKQLRRDVKLRDKKELIEEFIENKLQYIPKEKIKDEFEIFWDNKKEEKLKELSKKINADEEKIKEIIKEYEFRKNFLDDKIVKSLNYRLPILGRSKKLKEIRSKIFKFIDLFEW